MAELTTKQRDILAAYDAAEQAEANRQVEFERIYALPTDKLTPEDIKFLRDYATRGMRELYGVDMKL